MRNDANGTRIEAERARFLRYDVACPFDATKVGPRNVTREHLDVPPSPAYAATVRCPTDHRLFEVVFR